MRKQHQAMAFVVGSLFIFPMQAQAAEEACVSLLVGAGYAAKMRIKSGDFKTDWSGSFAIGQTRCQSLEGVPVGNKYTVEVEAILGEKKDCEPSITHSTGQGSITFQAWGTTLNVKCKMPSSRDAFMEKPGHEASPEGIKAKEALE